MRKASIFATVAALLFLGVGVTQLFAQEPKAPSREIPDAPLEHKTGRSTTVAVDHQGSDEVGVRLAFHMKEILNKATLFELAAGDGKKKIKVELFTKEEFEGRPGLGSVYGVVWLYSEGEGSLSYYLAGRVGVADAARVREAAEALVAETQGVAVRYSYLLD